MEWQESKLFINALCLRPFNKKDSGDITILYEKYFLESPAS